MSQVESIASKIVENATPVAGKNIANTSSSLMARQLSPKNVRSHLTMMNSAITDAFPNDTFSATIAKLTLMRSIRSQLPDIYAASFGDDVEKQQKIEKAYQSHEDLAVIQGAMNFARDIKPFATQAEKFRQQRLAFEKELTEGIDARVLPIANFDSWVKAINAIKRAPKDNAKLKAWFKNYFSDAFTSDPMFFKNFGVFRTQFNDIVTNDVIEQLKAEFGSAPVDDAEKLICSASGIMPMAVTWEAIVTRLQLASANSQSLISVNRSSELSTSANYLLDFSLEHTQAAGQTVTACASIAGDSLKDKLGKDELPSADDYIAVEDDHLRALIFHILAAAEVGIAYKREANQCNIAAVQSDALVSIKEHVLYPLLKQRLAKVWKAFAPAERELKYYKDVVNYVKGKRAAQYILVNIRPGLERALSDDLEKIIEDVRTLSLSGDKIDVKEVLKKAKAKLIAYDTQLVTPFKDQSVQITTDNKDFIQNGLISATVTRPVGLLECPTANSKGFAEAVILKDKRRFDAITKSAKTTEVASVYNRVIDLSSVSDYTVSQYVRPREALAQALNDAKRGLIHAPRGGMRDVKASEYIVGGNYTPINGDFYLQRVQSRNDVIMIQAGHGHVRTSITQVGNIHGSFAFGQMEGQRPDFVTPFATTLNALLDESIKDIFEAYGIAKIECKTGNATDIKLDEENEKYEDRVAKLDSEFEPVEVPVTTFLNVAASHLVAKELSEQVTPDMVMDIRQSELFVRKDMRKVLNMMAANLATQLQTSHSGSVVNLMKKSLTTRLDIDELQLLQQPVFLNATRAATKSIHDVVKGLDSLTFIVFLNELLTNLPDDLIDPQDMLDSYSLQDDDEE